MPAKLKVLPGGLGCNGAELDLQASSVEELEQEIHAQLGQSLEQAKSSEVLFLNFEKALWIQVCFWDDCWSRCSWPAESNGCGCACLSDRFKGDDN